MTRVSKLPESVVDDDGRIHHLLQPAIASGGQGAVFMTHEPSIGVKLLDVSVGSREVLARVRRLAIEDLTSIAAPLSILRELPGYTMVWLRGMTSMSQDLAPSGEERSDIGAWRIRTGGVKRRLALTAKLAEVLADLHGRGIVYVDLNLANVMVSSLGEFSELRLIDLDNLRLASDTSLAVHTPRWSAPEIFDRKPPTTWSDSYSLSLVTFAFLTGYHPFDDGDAVRFTDNDSPQRDAAKRGLLSSVIDPENNENQLSHEHLPLDAVLTPTLLYLYQQTFSKGRTEPLKRVTSGRLCQALWQAHDNTRVCSCGLSLLALRKTCPNCGKAGSGLSTLSVRSTNLESTYSRLTLGSEATEIQMRHIPLSVAPNRRHDRVMSWSPGDGFFDIETAAGWSCSSRSVRAGESAIVTSHEGESFRLDLSSHESK